MDLEREIACVEREIERMEAEEEMGSLEQQLDSFEEDRAQIKAMCSEIDGLEVEQATFRKLFDELQEARQQLEQVSNKCDELKEPLQYEDSKQKVLFERCMGLEFRITEDRAVSLVFRSIDPCDPSRRFTITVDVDENNQWTVVSVDPPVHGLRALLNDLNKTGHFPLFCKEVRRKFKELCTYPTSDP